MTYSDTFLVALLFLAGLVLVRLLLVTVLLRLGRSLWRSRRLRRPVTAAVSWAKARREALEPSPRTARALDWLQARFDLKDVSGLPLTLLCAVVAAIGIMLFELSEEVIEREDLTAIDQAALDLLAPLRTQVLLDAFTWVTQLGGNAALFAVALTLSGLLWVLQRSSLNLGLWLTVLGSQAMLWAGKWSFGRSRPEALIDAVPSSASFPSGHATGAMAIYGFVAYALARLAVTERQRIEAVFWAAVVIALVAFSRIYLQVHYPSDVAAGLLTGGLWLLCGIALSEWRTRHDGR